MEKKRKEDSWAQREWYKYDWKQQRWKETSSMWKSCRRIHATRRRHSDPIRGKSETISQAALQTTDNRNCGLSQESRKQGRNKKVDGKARES